MVEKVFEKIPSKRLYEITGVQTMEINTVFQLYSLQENRPEIIRKAKKLLMMPDLFHYALCGAACGEYSMASTTQLWNAESRSWSREILDALGIPGELFPPLVRPGTKIGVLKEELQAELSLGAVPVIASAGHDTECAMAAVPTEQEDFAFVSCGTWALFGTEAESPCVSSSAWEAALTNEAGVEDKTAFLKNITGTWLIQECRNDWRQQGEDLSFEQLEQMAREAEGGFCMLDPNDPLFAAPGDMPLRIQRYARTHGQRVPETKGEIIRSINESLAEMYRKTLDELERCTKKHYPVIHLVGGGSRSSLLCQLTANACKRTVCAGPVEATALGNVGIQLMALGELSELKELRRLIAAMWKPVFYKPEHDGKGE